MNKLILGLSLVMSVVLFNAQAAMAGEQCYSCVVTCAAGGASKTYYICTEDGKSAAETKAFDMATQDNLCKYQGGASVSCVESGGVGKKAPATMDRSSTKNPASN
ncbi:MAG: hypothetical protein AB7G80_03320 [Dongiaceae bacterium]